MADYSGLLGFTRPLGIGPLVSQGTSGIPQERAELSREEFIRRCKKSENSEEWARNLASAFIGEEEAERIPAEQIEQSSEDFCEGLADFFGY